MVNAERRRADDVEAIAQDEIVDLAHGPGGGILDRKHAELRVSGLDRAEDFCEGVKGDRGAVREEGVRRGVGERSRPAEGCNLLRLFRRQSGFGHKFAQRSARVQQGVLQTAADQYNS